MTDLRFLTTPVFYLQLWTLLLLVVSLRLTLSTLTRRLRSVPGAVSAGLSVCAYAFFQYCIEMMLRDRRPPAAAFLVPALLTPVLLVLALRLGRGTDALTRDSVKESIDSLKTGLLCARPSGVVKLKNETMEALCREVTGAELSDGEAFWRAVSTGALLGGAEALETGERPIVRLPDGRVFGFSRRPIDVEGEPLFEILAADLTEEYRITRQLKEKEQQADAINRRLRDLGESITDMTIARERLAAKIRIHDDLGTALLGTRLYLSGEESVTREGLLSLWRQCVTLMRLRDAPDAEDEAPQAICSRLGLRLVLTGDLPEAAKPARLLRLGVWACATNTLRHAGGDTLYLTCEETPRACAFVFTNSGAPPKGPIVEGGGLGNLRREVERAGGKMEVESAPVFRLTITLERKDPS